MQAVQFLNKIVRTALAEEAHIFTVGQPLLHPRLGLRHDRVARGGAQLGRQRGAGSRRSRARAVVTACCARSEERRLAGREASQRSIQECLGRTPCPPFEKGTGMHADRCRDRRRRCCSSSSVCVSSF